MDRRNFLALAAGSIALPGWASPPRNYGWRPSLQATKKFKATSSKPYLANQNRDIRNTGKGRVVLLYKFLEAVTQQKSLKSYSQGIGDCVGVSCSRAVDLLTSVQMLYHRKPERWVAEASSEAIYAGSRVEIADGELGKGDGSNVVWAAEWVRDYGVVLRIRYGDYDLREYNAKKARDWGHKCDNCTPWGGGVPDELEGVAKDHRVKTVSLVKSWEEARDAIVNGYPVVVGSSYGFKPNAGNTRDSEGFLAKRGTWYHAMVLGGVDDHYRRPGGLFLNSWGSTWVKGPKRHRQPDGSFWADAAVIDGMIKEGDSFALSNYDGYPKRNLPYILY